MIALNNLFTSDFGLLSLGTILFVIGMAVYFGFYIARHVREDEAKAKAAAAKTR